MTYDDLICEVADHLNISFGEAKELLELMEWGVCLTSKKPAEVVHARMLHTASVNLPKVLELATIGLKDRETIKSLKARIKQERANKRFTKTLEEVIAMSRLVR
jgi:zona occludens toxin (predicted ATPase)